MGQCISGGSAGRRVDSFAQSSGDTLPQSSSESSIETCVKPASSSTSTASRSAVIKLLRKKNGRRRIISVKPGKKGSPSLTSGLKRRAIFKPEEEKEQDSMSKAEPGLEDKLAQKESTVEPHASAGRLSPSKTLATNSNKSTPKKKSKKNSTKSVTFVEPEIENSGKKSKSKIFKYSGTRKPLTLSNRRLDNDKPKSVSREFISSSKKVNLETCFASQSVLTGKLELLTTTSKVADTDKTNGKNRGTNGTDSQLDDCVHNSRDSETMGIHFSDDCESLLGEHQRLVKSKRLLSAPGPGCKPSGAPIVIPADFNENNFSSSFGTSNCTSNNAVNDNCNSINTNDNLNNLTDVNTNCAETVKNINLVREEIRVRRNLFFLNQEPPPQKDSTPPNFNMSVKTVLYKPNDRDIGSSKYSTSSNRVENASNQSKLQPARSTEIPIPKLYSVQGGHHQASSLKSSHSSLPVASSRLPVFSSGLNARNNVPITVGKVNSNIGNLRTLHPRIPSHPLRAPKYLDATADDQKATAGQWISGNEFFSSKDSHKLHQNEHDVRRETLPTKFGGNGVAAVVPPGPRLLQDSSSDNEIRRGSVYTNWGSKLPMYNSGVKKPAETVPFYMMGLYKNRAVEAGAAPAASTFKISRPTNAGSISTGAPFSAVSTGVVKQRASQYQSKISQLSSTTSTESPSPPAPSPLVRSSTYVKSASPPSAGSNTPVIPDPAEKPSTAEKAENSRKSTMRRSLPAASTPFRVSRPSLGGNVDNCSDDKENRQMPGTDNRKARSSSSSEFKLNLPAPASCDIISNNFPLARDASTSSSVASSEEHSSISSSYATAEADKAISDSEFLIDDEISDQPDLTLTFKDSSLILSPSSSGESLISCDLMLDYKESSCSGLGVPDSVLLVEESSLVGSPKESKKSFKGGSGAATVTPIGIADHNMVNTTSANNSRRSVSAFQGRNGIVSPIPTATSTPLTPSNKLSRSLNNRSSQSNLQSDRLYHQQNNSGHLPRRSSGLPVPITPDSKDVDSKISTENHHHLHGSPNHNNNNSRLRVFSTSKSPHRQSFGTARNRTLSPSPKALKQRAKEESTKVSKESQERENSGPAVNESSPDDGSFIQDILLEVTEYKSKLKELLSVLETNEKELVEKDEVIARQKKDIEYWKGRALEGEKSFEDSSCEDDSIIHRDEYSEDVWHKEIQLHRRKETVNSAAQTEYTTKPAVTYPNENDQVGQLVSFRIGRSSSASNKS